MTKYDPRKNAEGYNDPTPYTAEKHMMAQIRGKQARVAGGYFENIISASCDYYLSRGLAKIEKTVTTKVLSELKKLLETDRESYEKFFKEFGRILKEGLHTDFANAEKLKDLVMYESMNTEAGKMITLDDYVKAMPESQKEIYFITGDKRESVASSPALEYFRSKGYDVLFMTDPIDDWVMQSMFQYQKKNFKSIAKLSLIHI